MQDKNGKAVFKDLAVGISASHSYKLEKFLGVGIPDQVFMTGIHGLQKLHLLKCSAFGMDDYNSSDCFLEIWKYFTMVYPLKKKAYASAASSHTN